MSLDVELEKLRLQSEQRFEELARIGFEDMPSTENPEAGDDADAAEGGDE